MNAQQVKLLDLGTIRILSIHATVQVTKERQVSDKQSNQFFVL